MNPTALDKQQTSNTDGARRKPWLLFGLALAVLIAVIIIIWWQMNMAPTGLPPVDQQPVVAPDVTVVSVTTDSYRAQLSGYGEARPRYELELVSRVSGRVVELDNRFASGRVVGEDTPLVTLEDQDYRQAVADAEATLASARVSLLEEQREGEQARLDWQRSGMEGGPDSALVLREPQLASAQAEVQQAQQALASAQHDLADTEVIAPFNALVVSRDISPGSYLQAGTAIGTLYSTDRIEIAIALPTSDWEHLQLPDAGDSSPSVTLTSVETGQQWVGRVLRTEQHLDDDRQRSMVVAVDQPLDLQPALLPGTFLEANIEGSSVDGLWRLPSAALSQGGDIWYVQDDNTLARFAATPTFSDSNALYVRPPQKLGEAAQRVVTQPLSSYLPGMKVTPVEADDA